MLASRIATHGDVDRQDAKGRGASDAPPEVERGDWLYSLEPQALTEPDRHGWMMVRPAAEPAVWIPRALVFWRMAVAPIRRER